MKIRMTTEEGAQQDFPEKLERYIHDLRKVSSEANKSYLFLSLVRDTFKNVSADYLERSFPELERFVKYKNKTIAIKGRIDALLGNVIIEFERDMKSSRKEAEDQLQKYMTILWNREYQDDGRRVNYLLVATDGKEFVVFRPELETEKFPISENDISLISLEEFDIEKKSPGDVRIWLDIIFLSQEPKIPTTRNFSGYFGIESYLFKEINQEIKELIENFQCENSETFNTIFSEWSKYLSIAYGSIIENVEFFVKHTYLSLLAKLMIYSYLFKGFVPLEREKILEVLLGREFKKYGIKNFFEEDFFSWIIKEPVQKNGVEIAMELLRHLSNFDLSKLNEDVLKGLYEELLDKKERHDLGEVYTPDWLAEYVLRDLLTEKPDSRILDPACGSGTFLFVAIKLKKELLNSSMNNIELLYHIAENVKGIDIHPLAVLIAKTNYLLALGSLLKTYGRGEIVIPIYMADSIRLIDEDRASLFEVEVYRIPTVNDKTFFHLPVEFEQKIGPEIIDGLIDEIKDLAGYCLGKEEVDIGRIERFFLEHQIQDFGRFVDVIKSDIRLFAELIKDKKNSIWAFILKNKHKPIDFTYKKFDLIVGNPPWVVYNSIESIQYQNFLKKSIKENYRLTRSAELITHMELATLFLLRCSELYLKNRGIIAFVMPRSIFSADQHSNFRNNTFNKVNLKFFKILDLEDVSPLFRTLSCVVFARKDETTEYPIETILFKGNLETKNETYERARELLNPSERKLFLSRIGKRDFLSYKQVLLEGESWYYKKFYQGANVVPQNFWYVDLVEEKFGFDFRKPYVTTSGEVTTYAKEPWDKYLFEGNIEKEFIFSGVISSRIYPFSYITIPVVLPIIPQSTGFYVLKKENISGRYPLLLDWLKKAEGIWKEERGKKNQYSLSQWINYASKLSRQNPNKQYKVVYNETGKNVVSAVIHSQKHENRIVLAKGVIYYETDNKNEAWYLCSLLNSSVVNEIIKPMQAKGLFKERGIEKKVLEIPIPQFDYSNNIHQRLAELGEYASIKAQRKLEEILKGYKNVALKPQNVARMRKIIREYLMEEIEEINRITRTVLFETKTSNNLFDFMRD